MATSLSIFFFVIIIVTIIFTIINVPGVTGANWCVARSDASNQALQTALDYACASGADCSPVLSNGLCFLPNTIQAHASYAFNSYFQRKSMAPGSCDFSGTATIARTDPSYGSCVYPSSLSAAGGANTGTTPTTVSNNPNTPTMPMPTTPATTDGTTGLNPGLTPPLPPDYSKAFFGFTAAKILMPISLLVVLSFT